MRSSSGDVGRQIHSNDELMPRMIDGIPANIYIYIYVCLCVCLGGGGGLKKAAKSTKAREESRSPFLFGLRIL